LKDNARHAAGRGRLEVKRAVPGLANGAGDEPVRRVIVEDRHKSYPSAPLAVSGSEGCGSAPAPPPTTASLSLAPCPAGRGSRSSTPPPVSFSRSRKGRSGV